MYFSDSIRVSPHVFRLADKFHLDKSIIWENRHTEGIDRKTHETQARSLPALLPAVTLSLVVLSILLSIFLAPRRYSQFPRSSAVLAIFLAIFLAPRRYSQAVLAMFLAIFLAPRRYSQAVLLIFLAIFLAPRRYSQAVLLIFLAIFLAPRRYSQAVLSIFLASSAVISTLLLYFSILCKRTLFYRVPGLKPKTSRRPSRNPLSA